MNLTERKIEALSVEAGKKDRLVFDDTQRGLAVRVTAKGGKTYLCQYTLHGQKHRMSLGACSAISLSKARDAASIILGKVAEGKNPATERKDAIVTEKVKRARDRLTLRALIENWQSQHLVTRRASYAAEAVRALHHAFVDYLDLPAEALDRAAVVRTLDAMQPRRKRKDMGERTTLKNAAIIGRTAAYGRAAYGWSLKRGTVPNNPFENLPIAASVGKRDRVLTDEELFAVWATAKETAKPYGPIIQILILTGQRKSEVAGMAWPEISEDFKTWTIPATRTKNGVPQIVPLSQPAQAILRDLLPEKEPEAKRQLASWKAEKALVLPGRGSKAFNGWSKAKAALDKSIAEARAEAAALSGATPAPETEWRLHDLRRTLATGLQRLGVRLEVTESVLNHVSGSRGGIIGIYQRHDWAKEKRAALEAWGEYVQGLAEDREAPSNVTKIAFGGI